MDAEHDQEPKDDTRRQREATERLNDLNRVLVEARMLPKNRPLTPEEITDVRDAYRAYAKANDVKAARVGREIHYSASVVSEWVKGAYKGDVQTVTHAVNDWMERDRRRSQASRPRDYVQTWVCETIRSIAYQADKRCLMAAIVAPAGAGKTNVLKTLAEEMRGLYVYCDLDAKGREFLLSVSRELGLRSRQWSKASIKSQVIDALRGTRRILFLDEAHQLGPTISSVRAIYDQAEVPIVMAGTSDILQLVNDRTDGRGQFSSRCIQYNVLDVVRNAEAPGGGRGGAAGGRDLYTIEEIKAFFAMKRIRLTTDAMRLMWQLACLPNHGTLRLIDTIADMAADLSGEVDVLGRDHLIAALELLHNARARHLLNVIDRAEENTAAAGKSARVA